MPEPIVRLVYERTSPPGVDAGIEPLIAVCATEQAAEELRVAGSHRGRYVSWEALPLTGGTSDLIGDEVVHVVLLGNVGAEPRDPIGIAIYTDRHSADSRVTEEVRRTGDTDYRAVSLHVGWRAGDYC